MLHIHNFSFLDADGNPYKLRTELLSAVKVLYRTAGSEDSFTLTNDYNIDEKSNLLWVRLPEDDLEIVFNLNVEPLQTITTGLQTLHFGTFTTGFEVTATPVPLNSLQGYSPRVIDGYWYQYNDELQTFENTGIKASGTEITPGTVVDVVEPNNPNPVTSNAVYNTTNNINNEITNLNQAITNIENKVEAVSAKSYSVKMNGEEHKADDLGVIDLGNVDVRGNTRTLTAPEVVGDNLLPKGTLLDENDNILATDGYYYYKYRTAIDGDEKYIMSVAVNKSCRLDVRYTVYNNVRFGTIFVSKNGYDYEFSCSNSGLAQVVKFYRYNSIADPVLLFPAGNQFVNGTVEIQSTEQLIKRSGAITPNSEQLFDVYPFLTSYKKDRITVDSTPFDVTNLLITDFVVNVESAEVNFTDLLNEPVTLTFSNNTNTPTTVTVKDGEFETTSSELAPGEVAILVFSDKNNFIWNAEEPVPTVDGVQAVKVNNETHYPVDGLVDLGTISGDGKVKTVNHTEPDADGNIELNSVDYRMVWDPGMKYQGLEVNQVGYNLNPITAISITTDDNEETIKNLEVFGVPIDTYTLEVEGGVKSVDSQKPDNTGNVTLLPLYKNGLQVRKLWPAYDKYDLDYDNDRRSYVNNNGSTNNITSLGYGNIILTGSFLAQRTNFIIPTTLSAYSTYGDYMKWVVYNATTNSEQIPINDTEVYIGDKIEVIFNKSERKVFVFGSNGKIKLLIALT